jgi:hypothetical protein
MAHDKNVEGFSTYSVQGLYVYKPVTDPPSVADLAIKKPGAHQKNLEFIAEKATNEEKKATGEFVIPPSLVSPFSTLGFRFSRGSLADIQRLHQYQHITTMSVEVLAGCIPYCHIFLLFTFTFIEGSETSYPNPEKDAVYAVAYCIDNDLLKGTDFVKGSKLRQVGITNLHFLLQGVLLCCRCNYCLRSWVSRGLCFA